MIIETELIKQLSIDNIKDYLKFHGWDEKTSKFNSNVSNWRFFDDNKKVHVVTLIEDNTYDDYYLRLQELLEELSKILRKDKITICNEIIDYSRDVVKFHIRDPTAPAGTLSLEYGTSIFESIRNIFVAGAASANDIYIEKVTPNDVYPNKKVDKIIEYRKQLKIGQSEIGSYVITISTEIPRPIKAPQMNLEKEIISDSFERCVNLTINKALSTFKTNYSELKSGENENTNIISKSYQHGLSVNLCEAISELGKIGDVFTAVDIECNWAKTEPIPKGTCNKISLTPKEIRYIADSASKYRESYPTKNYVARGYVYLLDKEHRETDGSIGMIVEINKKQRHLKVRLSNEGGDNSDYNKAINAHQTERQLQCVGNLKREGTSYKLLDPHDVEVVDSGFLDEQQSNE